MAHSTRSLRDEDLLEIAEDVLAGRVNRDELAQQRELTPVDHRNVLAYVGVALILATRYRLNDHNRVVGALSDVLYELTYRDTQAHREHEIGINSYVVYKMHLQTSASRLGLHERRARDSRRSLVLRPPEALANLVARYECSPAATQYLKDAGIEDEDPRAVVRTEARLVVETFRNRRGVEGLAVLLEEVAAALEEK